MEAQVTQNDLKFGNGPNTLIQIVFNYPELVNKII
jgi:hypothetical protein